MTFPGPRLYMPSAPDLGSLSRALGKPNTKTKTKQRGNKHQMSTQVYISRRQPQAVSFTRGRNTIRHERRSLGSISQVIIIGMITLVFGLIYVAEGTKATSFDYEISAVESEITEMTARRSDLAVEKARLTSVATAKNSTVAAAMEDATVTGYATE